MVKIAAMKIGLLNPWTDAAENQLIPIVARAVQQLGHTVVECKNSQDILHHRPDFVLAFSRSQPKLTNIPTYGLLFDPRSILLSQPSYLANIFTYDGVFTIFDSLKTFAADLAAACRQPIRVGDFYPTCLRVAWDQEIDFSAARLAYFGVNWVDRRRGLFTLLSRRPWVDGYGPELG